MAPRLLLATALAVSIAGPAAAQPPPEGGAPLLQINHLVRDFPRWRQAYEADRPAREAAGLRHCEVRQNLSTPDDVFITCVMTDVDAAHRFIDMERAERRPTYMGEAAGEPQVYFLSSVR